MIFAPPWPYASTRLRSFQSAATRGEVSTPANSKTFVTSRSQPSAPRALPSPEALASPAGGPLGQKASPTHQQQHKHNARNGQPQAQHQPSSSVSNLRGPIRAKKRFGINRFDQPHETRATVRRKPKAARPAPSSPPGQTAPRVLCGAHQPRDESAQTQDQERIGRSPRVRGSSKGVRSGELRNGQDVLVAL